MTRAEAKAKRIEEVAEQVRDDLRHVADEAAMAARDLLRCGMGLDSFEDLAARLARKLEYKIVERLSHARERIYPGGLA